MSEKPPRSTPDANEQKQKAGSRRKLAFDSAPIDSSSESPITDQESSDPESGPTPYTSYINSEVSDAVFEDIPLEESTSEYIDRLGQQTRVEATDAEFEDVRSTSTGVALYEPTVIHAQEVAPEEGPQDITSRKPKKRAPKLEQESRPAGNPVAEQVAIQAVLERLNSKHIPPAESLDVIHLPDQSGLENSEPAKTESAENTAENLEEGQEKPKESVEVAGEKKKEEHEEEEKNEVKKDVEEAANDNKKKSFKEMNWSERREVIGKEGMRWSARALIVGIPLGLAGWGITAVGATWGAPVAAAGFGGAFLAGLSLIASFLVLKGIAVSAAKDFFTKGGLQEWAGNTFGFLGVKGISLGKKGGADHKPAKKGKKAGGHDDHGHGGGGHGDHGHAANDNHGHGKDDHGHGAAAHH